MSIVIFFEETFQGLWQLQRIHIGVALKSVANNSPGQRLEGEGVPSIDRVTQERFKEHTRGRVLVVSQQLWNVPVHVDTGVVTVETELVILLVVLNPGMETSTISAEADTEQIFILGGVTEQEAALRLVFQK